MTDLTNGGQQGGPLNFQAQSAAPQISILGQYVKDFSFENPNAPQSLQPSQQPSINIQINVDVNPLAESDFEVSLRIEGRAEVPGTTIFGFDLLYAGVFRIMNVPQESLHALLMIECPRLIFPFAREIVASAVHHGGFPPLLIDPVDFTSLYMQKTGQANPASAGMQS